jgi:hypothetical protein
MERNPAKNGFIATVRQIFIRTARKPLKQKQPEIKHAPEELQDVYGEILGRVHMHTEITRKQSRNYHWFSRFLLWTTPLLSALVTVFAKEAPLWAFYVSGAVTILTVLNSAIRPYETELFAERYSNKFCGFHTDLRLAIDRASLVERDSQERARRCGEVLRKKNDELCRLIEDFNKGPDLKGQEAGKE